MSEKKIKIDWFYTTLFLFLMACIVISLCLEEYGAALFVIVVISICGMFGFSFYKGDDDE